MACPLVARPSVAHPASSLPGLLLAAFGMAGPIAAQHFAASTTSAFDIPLPGAIGGLIDLDGDGRLDLIAREGNLGRVYRNLGDRRFARSTTVPVAFTPATTVVLDYDGDGDQDVIVGITAFRNDQGTLVEDPSRSLSWLWMPQQLATIDYDGDGDLDVLVQAFGMRLIENRGAAGWLDVTATALQGLDTTSLHFVTGDIDGDGDHDVVKIGNFYGPVEAQVWRNNGSGGFVQETAPSGLPGFALASHFTTCDFDGDGKLEVLFGLHASQPAGQAALLRQTPNGWSATPMTLPAAVANRKIGLGTRWNADPRQVVAYPNGILRLDAQQQFVFEPFPVSVGGEAVFARNLDGDPAIDVAGATGVVFQTQSGFAASEEPTVVDGLAIQRFLDLERHAQPTPFVEVLYHAAPVAGSSPALVGALAYATNAPIASQPENRALRTEIVANMFFPTTAALVRSSPTGPADGILAVRNGAATFYERGPTGFVPRPVTGLPNSITSIHAADLDGDGHDEVLLTAPGLALFERQGSVFVDRTATLPAGVAGGAWPKLADLDGDGDLDFVQARRFVWNNGDGTWSLGPSFAGLSPVGTIDDGLIDFDGDGDLDVFLVVPNTAGMLLENTGNGFVDVTAARLPAGAPIAPSLLTRWIFDVDGDGDDDLVFVNTNATVVLHNDGGTFVATTGPSLTPHWTGGNTAQFVDLNHDGSTDLFLGNAVLHNQRSMLRMRTLPAAGARWEFEFSSWRRGPAADFVFVFAATDEQFVPLPGLGNLFLHGPVVNVAMHPLSSGEARFAIPLPPAALSGQVLRLQPAVLSPATASRGPLELGNVVRARLP
jgi:hypothetical protein